MKTVVHEDILDHVTYIEQRDRIRASAMRAKDLRRVHAGPHLTFLFENPETVGVQVTHAGLAVEVAFSPATRQALALDLGLGLVR
jgi:hypothetical protein